MSAIRARVHNGRLIVDAPTSLPEGTVLDLVVDDHGDELDASERAALNAAITKSWTAALAGQPLGGGCPDIPAEEMTVFVRVTPQAEAPIRAIDGWWRIYRPAAPDLFAEELAHAFATIRLAPEAGQIRAPGGEGRSPSPTSRNSQPCLLRGY